MPSTARYVTSLAAFASAAVGVQYAYARLREYSPQIRAIPEYVRTIGSCDRELRQMEADQHDVLLRLGAKQDVVASVIAGRTDLRSAARVFRDLNARQAMWRTAMSRTYTGRNEDECVCQNVIACVRAEEHDNPAARAAADRLVAEMEHLRHSDGLVRLD